ncbi:MAG: hypothetical protein ACLFNT_05845 [Spirochaetales bacterium]
MQRSIENIGQVVAFVEEALVDGLFDREAPGDTAERVAPYVEAGDVVVEHDWELYICLPEGQTRSKFSDPSPRFVTPCSFGSFRSDWVKIDRLKRVFGRNGRSLHFGTTRMGTVDSFESN